MLKETLLPGCLKQCRVKPHFFGTKFLPSTQCYLNRMFLTPNKACLAALDSSAAPHPWLWLGWKICKENSGEGWVPHPFLIPSPAPPHRPHGSLIFVHVCFSTAYGLHYTQTSRFHNYTMMGVPVKAIKQILFPPPCPSAPRSPPHKTHRGLQFARRTLPGWWN